MSKRCDLTGVGPMSGHKVSHSNRKSNRRFVPNLQNISFLSTILGQNLSLKVTPATLRTVDHNGGIDNYLLTTSNLKLTTIAQKIKRKIKKMMEAKGIVQEKPEKAKVPAKAVRPKKKTPAEKAAAKAPAKKVAKAKKPASEKKVAEKKAPAKKAAPKKVAAKKETK